MTVNDLLEGTGNQVLAFSDYLSSIETRDAVMSDFKKLGQLLFKDGWSFHDDHGSPRFVKGDDTELTPGGGWAISLPGVHDRPRLTQGILECMWSGMKVDSKGDWHMCVFTQFETAHLIITHWGLETFKQFLYTVAKPRK